MNRRRSEGASQSRARLGDQYRGWVRHHRLSAADSLARVMDKPLASLMTWLVIGIALALPVALDVALDNAGALSEGCCISRRSGQYSVARTTRWSAVPIARLRDQG